MKTRRILTLSIATLSLAVSAHGATWYWDGNQSIINSASDNISSAAMNWLNGGNWDDGVTSAPLAAWTANDFAIFGGTFAGTQTVTLGSGIAAGELTIGGVGSAYTISLTGTGFNQLGLPSGPITINAGSTLSADAASNNAHNIAGGAGLTLNGGTLTSINGPAGPANDGGFGNWLLRGPVTVGGSAASTISSTTLVLNAGGGAFAVNDATSSDATDLLVSASIIAGPSALNKSGAGTMELTAVNTFTNTVIVDGGLLKLASTGSLAGGAAANIGGRFRMMDAATVAGTLTANAGGSIELENSGAQPWTKAVEGAGTFVKGGAGTLTVGSGLINVTGGVTVESGLMEVTRTGGVQIAVPLLIKAGATFRITGDQYNNFVVPGGVTPATPGITVENGATLEAAGTVNNANNITGLILKGGSVINTGTTEPTYGTFIPQYITVSDFPSVINVPELSFRSAAFPLDVADTPGAIDLDVVGPVTPGDGGGGAGGIVKTGAGTVRFQSNVVMTNAVTINAGAVVAENAGIFTSGGGYQISNATLVLNNTVLGGKLSGGQTVAIGAGGTVRVTGDQYNTVFFQNWVIENGGLLSFENTAQNANNAGSVTLKGGTVAQAGNPDGGYAHLIISNGVTVQDNPSTWSAELGFNGMQIVNVGETGADVDFNVTGRLRGNGGGAHGFTKTGPGKMRVRGLDADYGGDAVVAEGVLEVFNDSNNSGRSPLSSSAIIIQSGAAISLLGDTYNALGTGGSMPSSITVAAGGTLLAANAAQNAHNIRALVLKGGTVSATNPNHDGFGNFILNGTLTQTADAASLIDAPAIAFRSGFGTVDVANTAATDDLTITSALLDHGGISSLLKTGPGTLKLSGTLSYTGVTTISEGTLIVNSALGSGANIVNADAGATNFNVSQTLGELNIGAGSVVTLGNAAPAPFAGEPLFIAASAAQAVPEPGSLALLFGAVGLLVSKRRWK